MTAERIHRHWPVMDDEVAAAQWQREREANLAQAARDLQRSLHDLVGVAKLSGLSGAAHGKVDEAIRALQAALADQQQAPPF